MLTDNFSYRPLMGRYEKFGRETRTPAMQAGVATRRLFLLVGTSWFRM